jgi:hypothetical protein
MDKDQKYNSFNADSIFRFTAPVEQCAVIWFLWLEGVKTLKIYRRVLAQHGENCIMQRKVERFQSGRTSIVDEDHSGCLTTS